MEQYVEYVNPPPLVLIQEACQNRNGGHCQLYRQEERVIEGKKVLCIFVKETPYGVIISRLLDLF